MGEEIRKYLDQAGMGGRGELASTAPQRVITSELLTKVY